MDTVLGGSGMENEEGREGSGMEIEVTSKGENTGTSLICVNPEQPIGAEICNGLGIALYTLEKIKWGGNDIDHDQTCDELDIRESARITVTIGTMPTGRKRCEDIMHEMVSNLNHGHEDDETLLRWNHEDDETLLRWKRSAATYGKTGKKEYLVNFSLPYDFEKPNSILPNSFCTLRLEQRLTIATKIEALPECFHNIRVGTELNIMQTSLSSLPSEFGNIRVGQNLKITSNSCLVSLPESFGKLGHIRGNLWLRDNKLHSLPESFGQIRVGGDLLLGSNDLQSLPESFGEIEVGGGLDLSYNKLESLPESFGGIRVGGALDLSHNELQSLPESFGEIEVGGSLDLSRNELQSLPESFGKIRVGRNLTLSINQLQSLPESFREITVGGDLVLIGSELDPTSSHSLGLVTSLGLLNNVTGSVFRYSLRGSRIR